MDPVFWQERWQTRQIGFHQSSIHPFLERWWPTLHAEPPGRVYVPLCGKSLDMIWLAVRGHRVVGTELVGAAVQEFFGEVGTAAQSEVIGPFRRHVAGSFEILEGDAFALTPELLGPVQGAYDRAALVALPPAMRERYVASFARLMPTGSRTLLVAFEYPQRLKAGPPFSVEPDEVTRLYGRDFVVRELERVDIIGASPKFAEAGIPALHEVAYALERKE
jgi:thiopurine S-methyltransferase